MDDKLHKDGGEDRAESGRGAQSSVILFFRPNGHIKSDLFSAADNCSLWFAVVAGNASAYSFSPSAQFQTFHSLLTAALCSG